MPRLFGHKRLLRAVSLHPPLISRVPSRVSRSPAAVALSFLLDRTGYSALSAPEAGTDLFLRAFAKALVALDARASNGQSSLGQVGLLGGEGLLGNVRLAGGGLLDHRLTRLVEVVHANISLSSHFNQVLRVQSPLAQLRRRLGQALCDARTLASSLKLRL